MPFPETPRVLYRNNPLTEVVCQLRFPPILAIAAGDPADFQDQVRQDYPDYSKGQPAIQGSDVAERLRELGLLKGEELTVHRFSTDDEMRTISLAREFVAVSENGYRRWEDFRSEVQCAKDALEEVYEPSSYKRIGLRYKDAIDREALGLGDVPWTELLDQSLIGLLGENEVAGRIEASQSTVELRFDDVEGGGDGSCTLRYGLVERSDGGEPVYLIDADFYHENQTEAEDVLPTLDEFNRMAGNLFRWAIAPRLEEALEPQPLDGHGE